MTSQSIASTTAKLIELSQQPKSTNGVLPVPSQQPQSTSKIDGVLITGLVFLIIGISIVAVG